MRSCAGRTGLFNTFSALIQLRSSRVDVLKDIPFEAPALDDLDSRAATGPAGGIYRALDAELLPEEDRGVINIMASGPDGVGLSYMERQAERVEALSVRARLDYFFACWTAGSSDGWGRRKRSARISVSSPPPTVIWRSW